MSKLFLISIFSFLLSIGYCVTNTEKDLPINPSGNIKIIQDFTWKDLSKKVLVEMIGSFYDKAYSIIENEVGYTSSLDETFTEYLQEFIKFYYEETPSASIPEELTSKDIQFMISNIIDTKLTTENVGALLSLAGVIGMSSATMKNQYTENADAVVEDSSQEDIISENIVLITSNMSFKGFPMGNSISTFKSVFHSKNINLYDTEHKTTDYYFNEDFVGTPAINYFGFFEDKFYQGTALFKIETTNDDNYVSKYKMLKNKLVEKYGEPSYENERGSSNQYISDAMAIKTGEGLFYCYWDVDDTYRITLVLQGDNYEFQFYVRYEDQRIVNLIDQIKEEKKYSEL